MSKNAARSERCPFLPGSARTALREGVPADVSVQAEGECVPQVGGLRRRQLQGALPMGAGAVAVVQAIVCVAQAELDRRLVRLKGGQCLQGRGGALEILHAAA